MPQFDRYRASLNRSFALRNFNFSETEINEHFWSFKVVSEYARYLAAQQQKDKSNFSAAQLFHASGPDARRIPPTVSDWLEAREELENWLRMAALVSAASYHEKYLAQITRSALMSDPFIREGASKSIDGTLLLKRGLELPFKSEEMLITRGEWSSRAANFNRLFGNPIPEAFPIAELDEIRKIRNSFAHGFGRALETIKPSEIISGQAKRISQKKLIGYIRMLSKSAKSIDQYLLANFIGEFEYVHAYHEWRCGRLTRDSEKVEVRLFQKHSHGTLGISKSHQFIKELIVYYNAVS